MRDIPHFWEQELDRLLKPQGRSRQITLMEVLWKKDKEHKMADQERVLSELPTYHVWLLSEEHGEVHIAQTGDYQRACDIADARAREGKDPRKIGEDCFVTKETVVYRSFSIPTCEVNPQPLGSKMPDPRD